MLKTTFSFFDQNPPYNNDPQHHHGPYQHGKDNVLNSRAEAGTLFENNHNHPVSLSRIWGHN